MPSDKERIRLMNECIIKSGKEFDEQCRLNEKLDKERANKFLVRMISFFILLGLVVYYHIY